MAITLKNVPLSDSVRDSNFVINDNISVIQNALNDIFQAFNRNSGRFDNTNSWSNGDIRTKAITITTGNATLIKGNLRLNTGSIEARGPTASIGFGNGSYFEHVQVSANSANFNVISFKGNSNHGLALPAITPSEMEAMKLSGELPVYSLAVMVGGTGATGATGPVLYDGNDWWKLDMTPI